MEERIFGRQRVESSRLGAKCRSLTVDLALREVNGWGATLKCVEGG